MQRQVSVVIEPQSALAVEGDVLALKYADGFYGVDEAAYKALSQRGIDIRQLMPSLGHAQLFDTKSSMRAKQVLFIGVGHLYDFQYKDIKEFSCSVLSSLATTVSTTRRLVVTLHGVGYGLDEIEVLRSEIAGFVDAIRSADFPVSLESIVIAKRNQARAQRLQTALETLLPDCNIPVPTASDQESLGTTTFERLQDAGYSLLAKHTSLLQCLLQKLRRMFITMKFRVQ